MHLFGLWLGSIAISYLGDMKNSVKIIKDIAGAGYKLDLDGLRAFEGKFPGINEDLKISYFIPGYNLYKVYMRNYKYEMNKNMVLQELISLNLVEEMTDEEKEKYNNSPSFFTAILIFGDGYEKKNTVEASKPEEEKSIMSLTFEFLGKKETIKFELDSKTLIPNIVEVTDGLKVLTSEQLLTICQSYTFDIFKNLVSKYDSVDEFKANIMKAANEGKVLNCNGNIDTSYIKSLENSLIALRDQENNQYSSGVSQRLARYKLLRASLKENGYLTGEEMEEYKSYDEDNSLKLNLK